MIDSKPDIFFSDLRRIFSWHRKKILIFFFACFATLCVLVFQMEPTFLAKATFQQGINPSEKDSSTALKSLILPGSENRTGEAIALMKANLLHKGVIEKLGLQVKVQPDGACKAIKHRFLRKIRSMALMKAEKEEYFLLEKVNYCGLEKKTLFLKVLEDGCFSILDTNRKQIALSSVGKKVTLQDVSFTLSNIPAISTNEEIYKLTFSPMWKELNEMKKRLTVTQEKNAPSFLTLVYSHSNPYLAKDTLNKLMLSYKSYLYRQSAKIAKLQKEYLEKRQLELTHEMDDQLHEYATELGKNFSQSGFFTFEQKINKEMKKNSTLEAKIFELRGEYKRLSGDCSNWLPQASQRDLVRQIYSLKNEINTYSRQQEEIEFELLFSSSSCNNLLPKALAKHKMLTDTHSLQLFPFSLVSNLKETKSFFVSDSLHQEYENLPRLLGKNTPFTMHIDHLIGLKREILRENHLELIEREFGDIDLATCEKMLRECKSYLEYLYEKNSKLTKAREDFYKRDFDLQSLQNCIDLPIVESLLAKVQEQKLKMQDRYLLTKERDHLEESVELWEKTLYQLLEKEIKETGKAITSKKAKINDLQQLFVLRVNKKIVMAKNALTKAVEGYKAEIEHEIKQLQFSLDNESQGAVELTSSWVQDNKFEMRKKLGLTIMEGVTKAYEAKNIENNIYKDSSKIIDSATLSIRSQTIFILLLLLLFSFLITLFYFGLIVASRLRKGDLYTKERLEEKGLICFENVELKNLSLDKQPIAALEFLRKLSLFIGGDSKIISIISKKYAAISYLLAELYALENKKTLLITLNSICKNSAEEFEKYLVGNTSYLPVKNQGGYDLLSIGNLEPFATEKIKSEKFQIFLSRVATKYEKVICYMNSDSSKVVSYIISSYCDKTILGYNLETFDLNRYFDVEKRREMSCLGFIEEKA